MYSGWRMTLEKEKKGGGNFWIRPRETIVTLWWMSSAQRGAETRRQSDDPEQVLSLGAETHQAARQSTLEGLRHDSCDLNDVFFKCFFKCSALIKPNNLQ